MVWQSFGASGRICGPGQGLMHGAADFFRTSAQAGRIALVSGLAGLLGSALSVQAMPGPDGAAPNRIEQAVRLIPRRPLMAHLHFCLTYAAQCDTAPDRRDPVQSLQDRWNTMMRINFAVNRAIRSKNDDGFDTWNIDLREGDCEDYALQKRADLIALGWPTTDLRLAIGHTRQGEPHAVLLVRIGEVDYALDNLTPSVKPWDETSHDYLILQDRDDPRLWHDVASRGGGTGTS